MEKLHFLLFVVNIALLYIWPFWGKHISHSFYGDSYAKTVICFLKAVFHIILYIRVLFYINSSRHMKNRWYQIFAKTYSARYSK